MQVRAAARGPRGGRDRGDERGGEPVAAPHHVEAHAALHELRRFRAEVTGKQAHERGMLPIERDDRVNNAVQVCGGAGRRAGGDAGGAGR